MHCQAVKHSLLHHGLTLMETTSNFGLSQVDNISMLLRQTTHDMTSTTCRKLGKTCSVPQQQRTAADMLTCCALLSQLRLAESLKTKSSTRAVFRTSNWQLCQSPWWARLCRDTCATGQGKCPQDHAYTWNVEQVRDSAAEGTKASCNSQSRERPQHSISTVHVL